MPVTDVVLNKALDTRVSFNDAGNKQELAAIFRGIADRIDGLTDIQDISHVNLTWHEYGDTYSVECLWTGFLS